MKYPHWQGQYQAAVSESGSPELSQKIQAAEQAIFDRLQKLTEDPAHRTERQAIADALAILRKLQRDKLSFPGWKE
jgi:hypothetical protein